MKPIFAFAFAAVATSAALAAPPQDAPVLAGVQDAAQFRLTLESVVHRQTGRQVDLAEGKWQVVYGSRILTKASELALIDPKDIAAIDILTRKNGSFEGTIVLSLR